MINEKQIEKLKKQEIKCWLNAHSVEIFRK